MAVSKKDRDDYEKGIRDSHKDALATIFNDDIVVNHPDSSAYYKGRESTRLDEGKKTKDPDK